MANPNDSAAGKQLFNSPFLEKITRTHISVPLVLYYGISAVLIWYTLDKLGENVLTVVESWVLGFLAFTLLEYTAHRKLFHMITNTKVKEKIQYGLHGVHHDYPRDKDRLAMPPFMSILLAAGFLTLFYSLMGNFGVTFCGGFLAGYATYLAVHYIVHAWRPPNNMFKILWTHHSYHHYKDHERAFGVSSPLWDVIFRTMPKKD